MNERRDRGNEKSEVGGRKQVGVCTQNQGLSKAGGPGVLLLYCFEEPNRGCLHTFFLNTVGRMLLILKIFPTLADEEHQSSIEEKDNDKEDQMCQAQRTRES